jgi:hypothetical protein
MPIKDLHGETLASALGFLVGHDTTSVRAFLRLGLVCKTFKTCIRESREFFTFWSIMYRRASHKTPDLEKCFPSSTIPWTYSSSLDQRYKELRDRLGECQDPSHRVRLRHDQTPPTTSRDLSLETVLLAYRRYGPKWTQIQERKLEALKRSVEDLQRYKDECLVRKEQYAPYLKAELGRIARLKRKRQGELLEGGGEPCVKRS